MANAWGARLHRVGLALCARRPRILMYHSVVRDGSPYARAFPGKYVEERVFIQSMEYVKRYCRPVSLDALLDARERGLRPPSNAVVVTFDDGYANNWLRACPILCGLGIPATFFVTTGFVDGSASLWTDVVDRYCIERGRLPESVRAAATGSTGGREDAVEESRALKRRLKGMRPDRRTSLLADLALDEPYGEDARDALEPLTWPQVRALAATPGMTVAPHTVSHPSLGHVSGADARREIAGSLARLREEGVDPSPVFAYPYGDDADYDRRHTELLRDLSFRCALATRPDVVGEKDDPYALPRYEGKNEMREFIRHVSGVQGLISRWRGNAHERSSGAC
ncbi:polysaccharide deacetylase family protein [Candidatus Nitrospira bockiana]